MSYTSLLPLPGLKSYQRHISPVITGSTGIILIIMFITHKFSPKCVVTPVLTATLPPTDSLTYNTSLLVSSNCIPQISFQTPILTHQNSIFYYHEEGEGCSQGKWVEYPSSVCPGEVTPHRNSSKVYLGASSLALIVSGASQLGAVMVQDYRGGQTAQIKFVEPGEYYGRVFKMNSSILGGQWADCDCPEHVCGLKHWPPGENAILVKEFNITIQPNHEKCFTTSTNPPECSTNQLSTEPGRWVQMDHLEEADFPLEKTFASRKSDWAWMPETCFATWMKPKEVRNCLETKKVVIMGYSRERTNYFDLIDLANWHTKYAKLQVSDAFEDHLYWIAFHGFASQDAPTLNRHGMQGHVEGIVKELNTFGFCSGDDAEDSLAHIVVSDDSIWYARQGYRERYPEVVKNFLIGIKQSCPHANLYFKAGSSLDVQALGMTWPRVQEFATIATKVARELGYKTINSFPITHPWIRDASYDHIHFYETGTLKGNFVSKTVTMMILKMICE